MNIKHFTIISLLFVIIYSACAAGNTENSQTTSSPDYTDYNNLSTLMAEKKQGEDFFLIDVRTKEEYEAGHIPSALLIPVQVFEDNIPTNDKNAIIIVYCRSGARAGTAKDMLESKGYTNVFNFGSYRKWEGELTTGS